MAGPDACERAVAAGLRSVLTGLPTGAELWADDYDTEGSRDLLTSLELFLPAVLRTVHTTWRYESLDAFHTITRRKTAERTAELFGLALLIEDQAWTPFELELRVAAEEDTIEWLRCRMGSHGGGAAGLDRRFAYAERAAALELVRDRAAIDWVFGVSFDE